MTHFYHLERGPTWKVISDQMDVGHFGLLRHLYDQDIFFANIGWQEQEWMLPPGHRAYMIMVEGPDTAWVLKQRQHITAPIFVLGMVNNYGFAVDNVLYVPWIEWHYQCREMLKRFPWSGKPTCKKVISSLSARVTQSKIWSSMTIVNSLPADSYIISLSNKVEEKNVHSWIPTNRPALDVLTQQYRESYLDHALVADRPDLHQQTPVINHDYTSRPYVDCVFNINNESWHYSYHQDNHRAFCWPGPFLTEKTMKVLCSETALVANGQFDTYRTLESLGFQFDYGLNLAYDAETGNLDRALGMIDMLNVIGLYNADYWFERTYHSRCHNRLHITSGDFFDVCESINQKSLDSIKQRLA